MKVLVLPVLLAALTACGKSSSSSDAAPNVTADVISTPVSGTPNTGADAEGETPVTETPATDGETPVSEVPSTDIPTTPVAAPLVALEVNAANRDPNVWAYLDLDTGKVVPEGDASYDLAFQRFVIKQNPAVSSAFVADVDFESILTLPAGLTYHADVVAPPSDTPASAAAGTYLSDESGEGIWWAYDMTIHQLAPFPKVYFVRTNGGQVVKFEVLNYYGNGEKKEAGYIQIQFQALTAE